MCIHFLARPNCTAAIEHIVLYITAENYMTPGISDINWHFSKTDNYHSMQRYRIPLDIVCR